MIQLNLDSKPYKGDMDNCLQNVWVAKTRVSSVERITVNGMNGATGQLRYSKRDGVFDARFVAVQQNSQRIFRLLFFTPRNLTKQLSTAFQRTTFSLRTISAREAAATRPWRLKIRPVRAGDTVAGLSQQMAVNNFKEETFRVLNGLRPEDQLRAGQLVKLVAD